MARPACAAYILPNGQAAAQHHTRTLTFLTQHAVRSHTQGGWGGGVVARASAFIWGRSGSGPRLIPPARGHGDPPRTEGTGDQARRGAAIAGRQGFGLARTLRAPPGHFCSVSPLLFVWIQAQRCFDVLQARQKRVFIDNSVPQ
jgi:hypothetical protein